MKKSVVTLMMLMALSLTACSNKVEPTQTEQETQTQVETETETQVETEQQVEIEASVESGTVDTFQEVVKGTVYTVGKEDYPLVVNGVTLDMLEVFSANEDSDLSMKFDDDQKLDDFIVYNLVPIEDSAAFTLTASKYEMDKESGMSHELELPSQSISHVAKDISIMASSIGVSEDICTYDRIFECLENNDIEGMSDIVKIYVRNSRSLVYTYRNDPVPLYDMIVYEFNKGDGYVYLVDYEYFSFNNEEVSDNVFVPVELEYSDLDLDLDTLNNISKMYPVKEYGVAPVTLNIMVKEHKEPNGVSTDMTVVFNDDTSNSVLKEIVQGIVDKYSIDLGGTTVDDVIENITARGVDRDTSEVTLSVHRVFDVYEAWKGNKQDIITPVILSFNNNGETKNIMVYMHVDFIVD